MLELIYCKTKFINKTVPPKAKQRNGIRLIFMASLLKNWVHIKTHNTVLWSVSELLNLCWCGEAPLHCMSTCTGALCFQNTPMRLFSKCQGQPAVLHRALTDSVAHASTTIVTDHLHTLLAVQISPQLNQLSGSLSFQYV